MFLHKACHYRRVLGLFLLIGAMRFDLANAIDWGNKNWAMNCDFAGNDLSRAKMRGEDCGGYCASTSGCTHFTWTNWEGGTCFLKQGSVSKSDAFASNGAVCGVSGERGGGGGGGGGGNLNSHVVTLKNNCNEQIKAFSLENGPGKTRESWSLSPGQEHTSNLPRNWGGRFFARFGWVGELSGWPQPDSLFEIKFDTFMGLDFYDISLVDGYNIPINVTPVSGTITKNGADPKSCKALRCSSNLLNSCPEELKLIKGGRVAACQSSCTKLRKPEYCCTEGHNTPLTCPQNRYGIQFKNACPDAYSYAFDDATSTFTCKSGDGSFSAYSVQFC